MFNACRFVMCFLPKRYGQPRLITLDTCCLYLSGYTPVYGLLAITQVFNMVRMKGIEPSRISTLEPKSSASTYFATSAFSTNFFFLPPL